jgi:hypothetical protein
MRIKRLQLTRPSAVYHRASPSGGVAFRSGRSSAALGRAAEPRSVRYTKRRDALRLGP